MGVEESANLFQLAGFLRDWPEMRYSPEGVAVTRFEVHVEEQWSGEYHVTECFPMFCVGNLAQFVSERANNKSHVRIKGKLRISRNRGVVGSMGTLVSFDVESATVDGISFDTSDK
jgi:primosomal replication protein N